MPVDAKSYAFYVLQLQTGWLREGVRLHDVKLQCNYGM